MVQDRRARHRPAPDPAPHVLDKQDYASTSCLGVWGLLVDSSGRCRSTLLPPLSCLALAFVEKCLLD